MVAEHLLGLGHFMDEDGRKIFRPLRERNHRTRRWRRVLEHDGRRHILDIERHAIADNQNQHERQHDAHENAAAVADEFEEFLPDERQETTNHAGFLPSFASSARACSTMAMKIAFISASGMCMRSRISDGLPSTSISP